MLGFVGSLIMLALIAWGAYLYYRVSQIERKIVQLHDLPLESDDDRF